MREKRVDIFIFSRNLLEIDNLQCSVSLLVHPRRLRYSRERGNPVPPSVTVVEPLSRPESQRSPSSSSSPSKGGKDEEDEIEKLRTMYEDQLERAEMRLEEEQR